MNETKNEAIYFCTKLRKLKFLADLGFRPFATMPDKRDNHLTVWLFDHTKALESALEGYYAMSEDQKAQEAR